MGVNQTSGTTTGATYVPLSPARDLDTRSGVGTGGRIGRIGPGETLDVAVLDVNGVPAAGVAAVMLNVTAVEHAGPDSFITVFPTPEVRTAISDEPPSPAALNGRPLASNLNVVEGQTIPNLVSARVGANGQVSIYNDQGSVDVVADVQGWFLANGG